MAKLFDKIGKKACNLILEEGDLVTIVKILEAYRLNKKLNVSTGNQSKQMVIKFKSNFPNWERVVDDLKAECQSTVSTIITDQFGETHSIELA